MYQAKESRTGYEVYAPERDVHSRDRLGLLGELRQAIETSQLILHYQPKAELATGEVTGVEALVRWQHPKRGLLPPSEFIPAAEQTALMRPLTLYVLELAMRQARAWADDGYSLTMAVNLSIPNLLDLNLPDDVARLLDEVGLPASPAPARGDREHRDGRPRARDPGPGGPAGAGSQALPGRLRDRHVIAGLPQAPAAGRAEDRPLVRARHDRQRAGRGDRALGHRAGTAAGPARRRRGRRDTEQTWQQLVEIGCEEAQGFYLQQPLPPREFTVWLRQRNGDHPFEAHEPVRRTLQAQSTRLEPPLTSGSGGLRRHRPDRDDVGDQQQRREHR